jgi:hypothetical protein
MGDMGFLLWGAAALAAILAIAAVVLITRVGSRMVLGALGASLVIVGAGVLAVERIDAQVRAEQRRATEARIAALNAQALVPNSHLACLDAAGGDVVLEACERALFAGPEQIAAAINYVGARLDVMRDIASLRDRDAPAYEALRAPVLRSLEADRFGLVAQVLAARDECKPTSCYAFDFLQNRERIIANMTDRVYDERVARYSASWNDKPGAVAAPQAALSSQSALQQPANHPVNIDFPTSDSIPAVSIMSNEPGRPGQNGVGAAPSSRPEPRQPVQLSAPAAPTATSQTAPARRPAQKSQAPRSAAPPPPAEADPFPQPVGSTTTGTQ